MTCKQMLQVKDAAEYLNCSVATMYRQSEIGDIPSVRMLGRRYWEVAELEAYIRAHRTGGTRVTA